MLRSSSRTAHRFTAALVSLGISLSACLLGCGGTSKPTPTAIVITGATSQSVDPGDSVSYTATVTNDTNNAGVTWTLGGSACTGSACGTLTNSTTTGVTYTAPATVTTALSVTITVTSVADSSLTDVLTISVPVNLSISTPAGALAGGVIGAPYSITLASVGGISPTTWSITQGALPAGLTLNAATGVISGTPTAPGSASITVKLTDSGSPALTATAAYTIAIAYPALTIGTSTLPNGTAGTAYTATLAATGGSGAPYTWTVASGTGLSAVGLTLSPSGTVSGTPTAEEIPGTFVVKVTDSYGDTATATITLTIDYPILTITTASLPTGIAGTPYTATLTASGGSKTGYTWSVTSGASSLSAAGLTLSSAGVVSGSTPVVGTATFTVQVTDSANDTATANLTVTIYPSLVVTTTTLPNGTEGASYTATLAVSGGSGSGYTWTVTSGTGLSAVGLNLSSSGAITGIPNAGETSATFTVQVKDSAGNTATATLTLTIAGVTFQGQVLSGNQPISGATIQLYTVGNTGNGSAATPMLTQTVTTDGIGMFNLNGYYTCGQSSTGSTINSSGTPANSQVYLVATGGSTSPTATSGNSALIMVTAVGNCSNLASTPFFTLNELTTAATAWALAPFTTSATHIGASATNALGIGNAFLDADLLANPANGAAATLPTNLTIETSKLNALADVLNVCAASDDASACNPLFAAATVGSSVPADTFSAALNIVKNPGQNVAAVFATIPTATTSPFAPTPIQSPNDWTMSLTVSGGGLVLPGALGVDSHSNIWVANQTGPISAFNAQGTPLSSTGFGASNGTEIVYENGIAIDTSDNIWITNQTGYEGAGNGNIVEFYGASSGQIGVSPQPMGYTNNLYFPDAIAADTNGDLFIANTGYASATVYDGSGNVVYGNLNGGQTLLLNPEAIAVDAAHGFWLPGSDQVVHIGPPTTTYPNGQLLSTSTCCGLSKGLATDATGHVWVADYLGGTSPNFSGAYAELAPDGTVLLSQVISGGISGPEVVAVDAAQNAWFTNFTAASITEVAGTAGTATPGTALSPTTGVYGVGGLGLDASLAGPFSIVPDRSGNLWICNQNLPDVTMFFGLAAPTATPILPVPTAP
jgi:hypothetical protein